ncbi:MAG: hypothetical protein ACFWT2_00110 [Thermoanaerobacterium thermosaccharolyticum]|jgi:hypothetical protein
MHEYPWQDDGFRKNFDDSKWNGSCLVANVKKFDSKRRIFKFYVEYIKIVILSRNIHEAVSAPVNVDGVNILLHSGGGEFIHWCPYGGAIPILREM